MARAVFATAGGAAKCEFGSARSAQTCGSIDYKSQDFAARNCQEQTAGRGVDVILDFVGAAYAEKHAACLASGGRQVLVGVMGGAQASINLGRLLQKRQTLVGVVMRSRSVQEKIELTRAFVRTHPAALGRRPLEAARRPRFFAPRCRPGARRRMEGEREPGQDRAEGALSTGLRAHASTELGANTDQPRARFDMGLAG